MLVKIVGRDGVSNRTFDDVSVYDFGRDEEGNYRAILTLTSGKIVDCAVELAAYVMNKDGRTIEKFIRS
jgi:hypothetical protein